MKASVFLISGICGNSDVETFSVFGSRRVCQAEGQQAEELTPFVRYCSRHLHMQPSQCPPVAPSASSGPVPVEALWGWTAFLVLSSFQTGPQTALRQWLSPIRFLDGNAVRGNNWFLLHAGWTQECHSAAASPICPCLPQAIPGVLFLPLYLMNNRSRELRSTRPTSKRSPSQ